MFKRPCLIVLVAVLVLLCLDTVRAQPNANPKQPPEPTIWVPMTGDMLMLGELTTTLRFSTGEEVEIGDPKLARWAEKASTRLDQLSHVELQNWFTVVRYYRIERAEPLVLRYAQALIKRDQAVNDNRFMIFDALSMVASKKNIRHLQRMLEEPIRDVSIVKAGRDFGHRPLLAATLYRLGDQKGFDYLIDSFREVLIDEQNRKGGDASPRYLLMNSYHSELVKRVEALREDPQIKASSHRAIDSVLEDMKVVGLPLEQLRELIADTSRESARRRSHAISVLAERGTFEDIALLEALHKKVLADPQTNGGYRNRVLLATIVIRCRLWKEKK